MTSGFVVVVTLLLLIVGYAGAKSRWPRLVRAVEGVPTVLVRNGVPDEAQMRAARVGMDEVMEAARRNGLVELREVRFAVLETGGEISIIPAAKG
nr:YetF domain-containing protein [Pararoseomonas indoligenes]